MTCPNESPVANIESSSENPHAVISYSCPFINTATSELTYRFVGVAGFVKYALSAAAAPFATAPESESPKPLRFLTFSEKPRPLLILGRGVLEVGIRKD